MSLIFRVVVCTVASEKVVELIVGPAFYFVVLNSLHARPEFSVLYSLATDIQRN